MAYGMLDYITAVNDGGSSTVAHKISVRAVKMVDGAVEAGGGTVTVSTNSAVKGTVVTLSASPDSGFVFNNWGVTSGSGVTFQTPYTRASTSFVMGDVDVTISGWFYVSGTVPGGGSGGYVPTEPTVMDRVITVPSIVTYYTDDQLNTDYHSKEEYEQAINKYGAIFKIVSFSETSDVEKLKQYGREWIRRNYFDGVISFTIKAIDLRLLGYETDKLLIGDRIPVNFIDDDGTVNRKVLTCLNVKYDLFKPENNTYKIGIPGVSDNPKYREAVGLSTTSSLKKKPNETKTTLSKALTQVTKVVSALKDRAGIDIDLYDIDVEATEGYSPIIPIINQLNQ